MYCGCVEAREDEVRQVLQVKLLRLVLQMKDLETDVRHVKEQLQDATDCCC